MIPFLTDALSITLFLASIILVICLAGALMCSMYVVIKEELSR